MTPTEVFSGSTCRCDGTKMARQPFCRSCYARIDDPTRAALHTRDTVAYAAAYQTACLQIDGKKAHNTDKINRLMGVGSAKQGEHSL